MRVGELIRRRIEVITPEQIAANPEQYRGWHRPFRPIETAGYILSQKTYEAPGRARVYPETNAYVVFPQVDDVYIMSSYYSRGRSANELTVRRRRDLTSEAPPQFSGDHVVRVKGRVLEYADSDASYLNIWQNPKLLTRE